MKIGILTFHRSYNYGAFMQCFSLVNRIKKDFPEHTVEVIDYTSAKILKMYEHEYERLKDETIIEDVKERKKHFATCQKILPLSPKRFESDDFSEVVGYMNENYDAVVVGSDAVWNWIVRGFPNLYFLKDYKGLKFSYAASVHGMNHQNISQEQKKYLKEAFSEFKYIGARDSTTENMVKFCESDIKAEHNCDPTAFLNLDDIPCNMNELKEKLKKKGVDFSKPIIGIMAGNNIGLEIKKKYKNKVQLVSLFEPNRYADVCLYELSPFEWAKVFSLFNVTLTHFFHGTMLSLVNGTPVVPIEFTNTFSENNKTKIKDVMKRLGLIDWRFETDYRNKTKLQRVLHRLGVSYDKKFWDSVCKKVDELINKDCKDLIKNKLENEAKSYNTFYQSLKSITQEERK